MFAGPPQVADVRYYNQPLFQYLSASANIVSRSINVDKNKEQGNLKVKLRSWEPATWQSPKKKIFRHCPSERNIC